MCVYVNRTITYLVQVMVCYFAYCVLDAIEAIKYFQYDYIPYITAIQIVRIGFFGLIIAIIWRFKYLHLSSEFLFLKRNSNVILGFFALLEIITFAKVASDHSLLFMFLVEYYLYWMLMQSLFNRTFDYSFDDNTTYVSHFSERPVVGTTNLTSPQKTALDCLIKTIDRRTSSDSINIALIGEWGSGKTGITNTLVRELQKRNISTDNLKKYFILVINAQVISNTKSIVEYVKKYFSELFRNYGVTIFNGNNSVAFLTIIADMLEDAKQISAIKGLADIGDGSFIDVEQERYIFAQNVRDLLKKCNRKNVLLVIDNIDRLENESQLLLILSEFASINGLITVLSLDPNKELELSGSKVGINGTKPEELGDYNELDKYIHVRIRIPEDKGAEYEASVSKQINEEAKEISGDDSSSILLKGRYNNSILAINNCIKVEGDSKLLTKLFFINYDKSDLSFGKYFEDLIKDHFCKSKELSPHIKLEELKDSSEADPKVNRITKRWYYELFNNNLDWSEKLVFNIEEILTALDHILKATLSATPGADILKNVKTENTEALYTYFELMHKSSSGIPVKEGTCEGLKDIVDFIPDLTEVDMINQYFRRNDFNSIEKYISKMKGNYINLYLHAIILNDFVNYMRKCMNNYRCFKIQLRECEILDMNYLDFIVKQWESSNTLADRIAENKYIKEQNLGKIPSLGSITLESIINDILSERYIYNYGNNFDLNLKSVVEAKLEEGNKIIDISLIETDTKKDYKLSVDGSKTSES